MGVESRKHILIFLCFFLITYPTRPPRQKPPGQQIWSYGTRPREAPPASPNPIKNHRHQKLPLITVFYKIKLFPSLPMFTVLSSSVPSPGREGTWAGHLHSVLLLLGRRPGPLRGLQPSPEAEISPE